MTELNNRIDFVYVFDVQDGNPNGDPDAGNLPRVDAETGMGLVTDVCLKRKVRNYVQVAKGLSEGYDIFIKEKAILNDEIDKAHDDSVVKGVKDAKDKTAAARRFMCKNYYDIRTFGAVMSTDRVFGLGPVGAGDLLLLRRGADAHRGRSRVAAGRHGSADRPGGRRRV